MTDFINKLIVYYLMYYIIRVWWCLIIDCIAAVVSVFYVRVPEVYTRPEIEIFEPKSNLNDWEIAFIDRYERQEAISQIEEAEIIEETIIIPPNKQLSYGLVPTSS